MPNITIVSNRLPISVKKVDGQLEYFPSVGGLATGLSSYAGKRRNKWVGWPGIASEDINEHEKRAITKELAKHGCYPIFLRRKQLDDFYNGYSNSILWPLFHNLPTKFDQHTRYWKAYQEVNRKFADAVLSLTTPGSSIWVHDYQLLLMPQLLKIERPHDTIGFFLHIPFPDAKTFATLKSGRALLTGMLGSDLIGFHTTSYTENFLDSCRELNAGVVTGVDVVADNRVVQVTDFPMGIDYQKFAQTSQSLAVRREARKLKRKYDGLKIILTVDRLDPTKGLVQRLRAYQEFLVQNQHMHGKVVMVMLAVPSRTEIDEYKALKQNVEQLVESINNTYGNKDWQPVDYMYTSWPFERLTALYQVADVAFITPLRDGMNLVAKEYMASKPNPDGVLILSETAGAAQELQEALLVNPRRRQQLAAALNWSLNMPALELKQRAAAMQEKLADNTVHKWAGTFMGSLQRAGAQKLRTKQLKGRYKKQLYIEYAAAHARLILLDYDGVLAPFTADPAKAKPPAKLLHILAKLSSDSHNVVAVISGRSAAELEAWFGKLPLVLAAEHGASIRQPGKPWKRTIRLGFAWKRNPRLIMDKYAKKAKGAFVEEKEFSLVWHYRKVAPYNAQKYSVVVKRLLKQALRGTDFGVYSGNKIVEVKSKFVSKGDAVQKFLRDRDFVLALGDDYTDEDMFEILPIGSYSIKIGRGRTSAAYRLNHVDDVLNLLKKLT